MKSLVLVLPLLSGCWFGPCGGTDDFIVAVTEEPWPESASAVIDGVEQNLFCSTYEQPDGGELHCSALIPEGGTVTAAEIVIDGLPIALEPVDPVYEGGAECGMGGRYFLYYP